METVLKHSTENLSVFKRENTNLWNRVKNALQPKDEALLNWKESGENPYDFSRPDVQRIFLIYNDQKIR